MRHSGGESRDGTFLKLTLSQLQSIVENYNPSLNLPYTDWSSSPNSIILLMKDIWRLSQDLNIYNCCHIYKEPYRIADCLAKKGIYNTNPNIWSSYFPRDIIKFGFEDYCGLSFNRTSKFSYS